MKPGSALVWQPKIHLTRHFGVFAAHNARRAELVALAKRQGIGAPAPAVDNSHEDVQATPQSASAAASALMVGVMAAGQRLGELLKRPTLDWRSLMQRIFGFDVLRCPCGGTRRVLSVITQPDVIRKILGSTKDANAKKQLPKPQAQAPP